MVAKVTKGKTIKKANKTLHQVDKVEHVKEVKYMLVQGAKRVELLASIIRRQVGRKIAVVFDSKEALAFHCDLFSQVGLPVASVSGEEAIPEATVALSLEWSSANAHADWVIFYDPPHLTGRLQKRLAALSPATSAFLFLDPTEVEPLRKATDLPLSQ